MTDYLVGHLPGSYHIPVYWGGAQADDGEPPPEPVVTMPDLSWVNGLHISMLVTNLHGVPLGDLAADLESVAWKLNDTSMAQIVAGVPGTAPELLEVGNRLLIEFDNGLPRWAGVIDLPRRWEFGRVQLTAYSGHRLLNYRVTSCDKRLQQVSAGGAIRSLLQEQDPPAAVLPGAIWLGGAILSLEYHRASLLDTVEDLVSKAPADFDISGHMENGRLVFRAHLYEQQGIYRPDVHLIEGINASVDSLEEQGPIINEWFTAGAGAGWGETGRLYGHARDEMSIRRYGLRQGSEIWSDIDDQTTLDARTNNALGATRDLYAALSMRVINIAPGTFAHYSLGDRVNVELFSMPIGGMSEMRRVVGREFRPRDGACEVLLL